MEFYRYGRTVSIRVDWRCCGEMMMTKGNSKKKPTLDLNAGLEPNLVDILAEAERVTTPSNDAAPKAANSKPQKTSKATPAHPQKDVMAAYMVQLGKIPLFTPEQEHDRAKELESLEINAWMCILEHPRTTELLADVSANYDILVADSITALLTSYRRAAAKRDKFPLPANKRRQALMDEIAMSLRAWDCDKALLDAVTRTLRNEVWRKKSPDEQTKVIFTLTQPQLLAMEQARGHAIRARNNFVRANLRLVVSVAKKFQNKKIPFIDLVQEGNMGLMKAVHRFDHRRGFRFSTYAHWWIRQSIERAIINKGSQVRLPVHVIDSRRQISRTIAHLQQELGRAPSSQEISKALELPLAKVEELLNGIQPDPISLDENLGDSDPRKFLDLVRDKSRPPVDEAIIRENTLARIRELMGLLNPMERDIIARRFGLGIDDDQTLDEIGKRYNLSRERVRQIQVQGLAKMRRMCDRRHISL